MHLYAKCVRLYDLLQKIKHGSREYKICSLGENLERECLRIVKQLGSKRPREKCLKPVKWRVAICFSTNELAYICMLLKSICMLLKSIQTYALSMHTNVCNLAKKFKTLWDVENKLSVQGSPFSEVCGSVTVGLSPCFVGQAFLSPERRCSLLS